MMTALAILIVLATTAAMFAEKHEDGALPRGRTAWIRAVAYWVFTLLIALEMAAGGLWDLLRIEFVRVALAQLGYPPYLPYIIGVWKIPCALVLLAPRFPRLKEWAYAGAFFNYTGAAASHFLAGDGAGKWAGPLVFAALTLASWALRPPERRLGRQSPAVALPAVTWFVPIVITAAFLVFSLATLPEGPPPP
jgi:hypothetical protein